MRHFGRFLEGAFYEVRMDIIYTQRRTLAL
jgi:hypothetical protein